MIKKQKNSKSQNLKTAITKNNDIPPLPIDSSKILKANFY